jgi:hypothetical protein
MVIMVRPSALNCERRVCCHGLAIHDEISQVQRFARLFVAGKDGRNTSGQMQITTMRGRKQGMPLLVMQQHERTTAQDFARTTNESSRNQGLCVDGFAMTIQVKIRRWCL